MAMIRMPLQSVSNPTQPFPFEKDRQIDQPPIGLLMDLFLFFPYFVLLYLFVLDFPISDNPISDDPYAVFANAVKMPSVRGKRPFL